MSKTNPIKRTIPVYLFSEMEKSVINRDIPHKLVPIVVGGKRVTCVEFQQDAFDILDDLETHCLLEADGFNPTPEQRGFATRVSTVAFQSIRELTNIQGKSLADVIAAIRSLARICALAVVVGIANLDINQSRRLLPMVRAI